MVLHASAPIVITGGAGFIGTNLANFLVQKGHTVVIVDDLSAGNPTRLPESATLFTGDVCDAQLLKKACIGAAAIVHLAALPRVQFSIDDPVAAHRVNVGGTLAVLEAAREAGVSRVVFAASSAAYGDQEVVQLHEDLPVMPKSPYALHKVIGESYLRLWSSLYGLSTVSLRFFNVYGPYFDPNGPYALVIGRFLALRRAGEPLTITGTGEQTRDFVHAHDVVRAIYAALISDTVGQGEIINIGSGIATSVNELARLIGGPVQYVAPRVEPQHTCASIAHAETLLGWRPLVSLEEGVREVATWYEGHTA